jgi:hypothetical protein
LPHLQWQKRHFYVGLTGVNAVKSPDGQRLDGVFWQEYAIKLQFYRVLTQENREFLDFSANPAGFPPPKAGFPAKKINFSSKENQFPWKIIHFSCKKNHLPSKENEKTCKENHLSCKVNEKASKENSLAAALDDLIPLKNPKSWVRGGESNEENEDSAGRERQAWTRGGGALAGNLK